jgi:Transposase DDE domain group 1
MTECSQLVLGFHPDLPIHLVCNAPETSSDGGALLLRQVDDRLGLLSRLSAIIPDARDRARIEHSRLEQLRQRVFQIALGYEDCNDARWLRLDPVLQLVCDRVPGDPGGLSSQPSLSRLENCVDWKAAKRFLRMLEEQYVSSFTEDPQVVVLDIDTTDDPTHGNQQLSFFHGFYDEHMYHPVMIFDGVSGQLVTALLRPGNTHAARGSMGVLRRIIRALKRRFPKVAVVVRGDSGFAVPRLMEMLEALNRELGDVDYLFGMPKNPVLLNLGAPVLATANELFQWRHAHVRHFGEFGYAAKTWSHQRRIIMKAERMREGENPRFVVTTIEGFSPELLYDAYCERGQCENLIKDFKNALSADRLSCSTFIANFFRLLEHAAAYLLMHQLRLQAGIHASELAKVQMDTLRLRLLKVAAHVTRSARRFLVRLPKAFPTAAAFCAISRALSSA